MLGRVDRLVTSPVRSRRGAAVAALRVLGGVVALAWAAELVDVVLLDERLDRYGIEPREREGLRGIVLAPLLHGGLGHLAANTVPFLVLGALVLLRTLRVFAVVTAVVVLVGGVGVWLVGDEGSVHVGASGVVFGYLGFLLLRGVLERTPGSVLVAVVVTVLYGGALAGLVPTDGSVSWEGHLFGFLGGLLAARLVPIRRRRRGDPITLGR
jgi:membrane associated rhomboid family serine protease